MRQSSIAAMLLVVACAPGPGETALVAPDVDAYAELHPYLEVRCATIDCHGDPGRPMRIFAETGLRMDGIDRSSTITPAELEANAFALIAIDPAAPDAERHILLLKPLATSEGGMEHVGDPVWVTRDNAEAQCLAGWLAGTNDAAWRVNCQTARDRWTLRDETPGR